MITFEAIGTVWSVDVLDKKNESDNRFLKDAILERISVFDKAYSRFKSNSWVRTVAKKKGTYTIPPDGKPMFSLYENLYKLTGGAMTPLIGKALEESGYDAQYSLVPKKMHAVPKWENTVSYAFPNLTLNSPVLFDFGAMGKGYLVDLIGKLLESHKVFDYCIDAGGDILYKTKGQRPLNIGLEHPQNKDQVIGVASLINGSICGSAGNRRKWNKFHHIINPHTLSSPKKILATWVIAQTAILADALTTALFFSKASVLNPKFSFEYLIVYDDYQIEKSEKFPAILYYK